MGNLSLNNKSGINNDKLLFNIIKYFPDKYIVHVKSSYFDNETVSSIFKEFKKFYDKYHEIPSSDQLLFSISENSELNNIDDSFIEDLYDFDINSFELSYIHEVAESWVKYNSTSFSIKKIVNYIKSHGNSITPDIVDKINDYVDLTLKTGLSVSFKSIDNYVSFLNPSHHIYTKKNTKTTGYSWFDTTMSGGFTPGTFNVFVGPPKSGKSLWLLNMAANAYKYGLNVGILSFELSKEQYMSRLSCCLMGIHIDDYNQILKQENKNEILEKSINSVINNRFLNGEQINNRESMNNVYINRLKISDATPIEIEKQLLKIENENKIKLDLVILDYLGTMNGKGRSVKNDNYAMVLKQLCEDLRDMAIENEWCVFTAHQTNRESYNSSYIGMENISDSSGISYTADSIYGICRDGNEYKIIAVAIRDGEGMGSSHGYKHEQGFFSINEVEGTFNE